MPSPRLPPRRDQQHEELALAAADLEDGPIVQVVALDPPPASSAAKSRNRGEKPWVSS